jgi:hypothetical protein
VGVEGEGGGEGEERGGLGGEGEMLEEVPIGDMEQGGQQMQVGFGTGDGGQHEVPDAEEREAGGGGFGGVGAQDEEQDLDNVVVALEIGQEGMSAEDGGDDVGQLLFARVHA